MLERSRSKQEEIRESLDDNSLGHLCSESHQKTISEWNTYAAAIQEAAELKQVPSSSSHQDSLAPSRLAELIPGDNQTNLIHNCNQKGSKLFDPHKPPRDAKDRISLISVSQDTINQVRILHCKWAFEKVSVQSTNIQLYAYFHFHYWFIHGNVSYCYLNLQISFL